MGYVFLKYGITKYQSIMMADIFQQKVTADAFCVQYFTL